MKKELSASRKCHLLLKQWRSDLRISNFEKIEHKKEIEIIDQQLARLFQKHFRIAVFGRVGVGKSSLINALVGENILETDIRNGSTEKVNTVTWEQSCQSINKIELIDTPGIDEINSFHHEELANRIAMRVDLIIFLLDSDITSIELEALEHLRKKGKQIILALNRIDQWSEEELIKLIRSIKKKLPINFRDLKIELLAASPREVHLTKNQKVRSHKSPPEINVFKNKLINLISSKSEKMLMLNAIQEAENFYNLLKKSRVRRSKSAAQSLIGSYAAIKASGVAINPLIVLDFAGSLACDTALVIQLSKLYGLQLQKQSAKDLLKSLSIYSSFIGGTQLGIQMALGILRQLLILATPLTNGFSLASAAPVALIQAALAVHTTKLTGRLAAKELLRGSIRRDKRPRSLLKSFSNDPQIQNLLRKLPEVQRTDARILPTLLP